MNKKIISLLLTLCMILSLVPLATMAAGQVTIYDTNSGCFSKTSGSWAESGGVKGYENGQTIYSHSGAATAEWKPELLFGGKYKVSIWNVVHTTNAEILKVEVKDKNGVKTIDIKHKEGDPGFVDLGEFDFEPGNSNYVKAIFAGDAFGRLNSIKLELMERGESAGAGLVPATGAEGAYPDYATRTLSKKDVALPETKADATKIYVAQGANGDGSEANPFGTIEQAQEKVRQIISSGYPANGVGVYIKGGTYSLDNTLTFSSQDSGTQDAPVIWQAYNGEKVSLTGGKVIPNNTFSLVSDDATLSRFTSEAKGKVYVTDLGQSGIYNVPKMDFKNSSPYVLAMGEKAGTVARWPNAGYARTANLADSSSRGDSGPRKKGFTYEILDPRPLRWTKATDVWFNGYWMTPYTIDYARLAVLNADGMQFSGKEWNGLGSYGNARYYALNILEEIDLQGEWYLDTDNNKLYVYPYEGWENQDIMFASKNFDVVNFDGASNVIIRGLNLEVAGGSGVKFLDNSSNCAMIGGSIMNVSGAGASINGKNNYVRDCDVSYVGAQGITVGGGDQINLVQGGNYAENNEIHNTGTGGGSKQGITITGCGNRVSNNHVYDIPTHGINGGGMELIIENNIIERTNLEMGDTGGLYFLNYGMGYGSKIRYNIVKDSVGLLAQTMTGEGALGIYLDDVTSGVEVYGNVVYNAQEPGIFGHGGRYLKFYNNILINCETPINVIKTGIAKSIAPGGTAESNIRKYDNAAINAKYPQAVGALSDEFGEPKYNEVYNNVTYRSGKFTYSTGVANSGVDKGNIQFADVPSTDLNTFENFDYSAIKAQIPDFVEIPFNNIGTYTGGERTDTQSVVFNNNAEPFTLSYPFNGQQNVEPTTTLKWLQGKGGIKSYAIFIAEDKDFNNLVTMSSSTTSEFSAQLEYGKTYYWRVKASPMLKYAERWNSDGICSFTTITADAKLQVEAASAKYLLEITQEGTEPGQFASGSKAALQAAVAAAESAADEKAKIGAIDALIAAKATFLGQKIPNTTGLSTLVYDDYTLDTVDQRPLGLFLRSYSMLNVTGQVDPTNSDNMTVRLKDEHPQYHYGMRYFTPQTGYVEAGTSVMAEQTTGSFSFGLMKTGLYPVEAGVNNSIAAKVTFSADGNIYADQKKTINMMPYEANKWYDVKMCVRLYNKTYDVYVNGEKKAENVPFNDNIVGNVNQIVYHTSEGDTGSNVNVGTFYIDNTIIKAPTSKGRNQYLMGLKLDGKDVSGFEPANAFYVSDMSADELKNANVEYVAGKNANVKVQDINGAKIVTVVNADLSDTFTYMIKSK